MPQKQKWWLYSPSRIHSLISTSLSVVFVSIVCILPNFWGCGLQISSPGTFMLTSFVRKAVKLLILFMGRSNELLSTSVAPSLPCTCSPYSQISASHVVWSFNHGIFPMKISYRIPASHPSTSAVMLLPLCHLYNIFSNLSSSPYPLRPHLEPDNAVSIPFHRLILSQWSLYQLYYSSSLWNSLRGMVKILPLLRGTHRT